jgi:predicted exporter
MPSGGSSPMRASSATTARLALIWLALALLLAGATALRWPGPGWLQTDLLALLPASERDPLVNLAHRRITEPLERQTVWLIGASDPGQAAAAAGELAQRLRASGLFQSVQQRWRSDTLRPLLRTLFPHRAQLLADADRELLRRDPEAFLNARLGLLYSPAGALFAGRLQDDPLGLFARYAQGLLPAGGTLVDGTPVFASGGLHYALVTAATPGAAMGLRSAPPLLPLLDATRAWAQQHHWQLHAGGVPLFTAYGTTSASREINNIGTVSMATIVLLLLWAFRSPRPLLLSLLTVACGMAGGIAGTVIALGEVHLITLVFGTSITGVTVDYAIHYLCDSLRPHWTPLEGRRRMFPSITLGMLTSVMTFLLLALTPFPGIRQIAVFSAASIFSSWATAMLLLPALARPGARRFAAQRWLEGARIPGARLLVAALVLATVPGLLKLRANDDIRQFYAAPAGLLADAEAVRAILPFSADSRFLLVSGADAQTVLRRQEALLPRLEQLQNTGAMAGFTATATLLPSAARQRENAGLLRELADSGALQRYLAQLGFSDAATAAQLRALRDAPPALTPEAVLAQLDPAQRALWLGCPQPGRCAGIIALRQVERPDALRALAASAEGVRWVDRLTDLSDLMRRYRQLALWGLGVALAVTIAVVAAYTGLREGLLLGSVPALAMLVSLAALGYGGGSYSVFNLMALLLVVGVGIDYAIFYRLSQPGERSITALAVSLDLLTTVLAFGMLMFSETPIISAFGATLVPGLLTAFALAFLLEPKPKVLEPGLAATPPLATECKKP